MSAVVVKEKWHTSAHGSLGKGGGVCRRSQSTRSQKGNAQASLEMAASEGKECAVGAGAPAERPVTELLQDVRAAVSRVTHAASRTQRLLKLQLLRVTSSGLDPEVKAMQGSILCKQGASQACCLVLAKLHGSGLGASQCYAWSQTTPWPSATCLHFPAFWGTATRVTTATPGTAAAAATAVTRAARQAWRRPACTWAVLPRARSDPHTHARAVFNPQAVRHRRWAQARLRAARPPLRGTCRRTCPGAGKTPCSTASTVRRLRRRGQCTRR